ncbi:nucleotidyltransferase domain-containing protein [bacterium]|nr:MAG: nucleotidyltransferase domain-containing protein [bacterium]
MRKIEKVLRRFKEEIHRIYGERLKEIILYGSWARGTATKESDIDLVVILKGRVFPGREIDRMIDVITELGLEYGVLISVYPISERTFRHVKSPLILNVKREGVVVWRR